MSFYNPRLPITPQLATLSLLNSYIPYSNLLSAISNPLLFHSPLNLNQNLQFRPPVSYNDRESDSAQYGPKKKCKLDDGGKTHCSSNLSEKTGNGKTTKGQDKISSNEKAIEIIKLDEDDEEDCLIIESTDIDFRKCSGSSVNKKNFENLENHKKLENKEALDQSSLIVPDSTLSKNFSLSDMLLAQLWNFAQPNVSMQRPIQQNTDPWNMTLSNKSSYPDVQNTLSLLPSENSNTSIHEATKPKEIILIPDDCENESTCQTTPQPSKESRVESQLDKLILNDESKKIGPTFENCIRVVPSTQEFKTQINNSENRFDNQSIRFSIDPSKNKNTEGIVDLKIPDLARNLATLPPFILSRKVKKPKACKKPKLMWSPNSLGPYSFETYLQQIEKALGMQITDEEKVIKTLEKYNNNIDVALGMIKRHKAQYKNYFRVKKIDRVQKPYS